MLDDATRELATRLALRFRLAIDEAHAAGEFDLDPLYRGFPRGCCGFTCDLLSQYLMDNGIPSWMISGNGRYGKKSHAWLILEDGTILDITADQFKHDRHYLSFDQPFYCGPRGRFHSLFEESGEPILEQGAFSNAQDTDRRLKALYAVIEQHL